MAIIYKQLYRHIRHVLGSEVAGELIEQQVVDLAQEWLVSSRNWRFLQSREAFLTARGQISLAGATWNEVALTLTETDAFAGYDWLEGDVIKITGGTGVTLGRYEVASKTDKDTIVLASSIAAAGTADVTATLELPRIALPPDFRSVVSLYVTDTTVDQVEIVSPALITYLRSIPSATGATWWRACIEYTGTPPVPVLSLHPVPTTEQAEVFRLLYTAGVTRGVDDSTVLNLPPWYEPLLIETVRAYALGMEPTKNQNLGELLANIEAGPLYAAAVRRDAMTQHRYGLIRNGAAGRIVVGRNALATEPGGPA